MGSCGKSKQRKKRYCLSDFRHSIKIWCGLTVPTEGDYDVTNDELLFEGRAKVQVSNGSPFFYGTSIEDTPTHKFTIRYNSSLEIERNQMIEHNGSYYRIFDVKNIDEDSIYFEISATKRGKIANEASWR